MGFQDFSRYARRVSSACSDVDNNPTSAQRQALNYRHGKIHIHGLDIRVEYVRGGVRSGTSPDGRKWRRVMTCPYGRIKRTVGLDGEAVDVFIGSHPESQLCFVVSQLDKDGNLDEHKCVLGTRNLEEAKKLYLSNYPSGWENDHLGEIRGYFMPDFRKFLASNAPRKNRTKQAAIPHDDGEICCCGAARRIEERTGSGCSNCGAVSSMAESRLKRTEQGLPDTVRVKGADDGGPGECPKCRERGETEWKNNVLGRCKKCDHVWFAHEKRGNAGSVSRLLDLHRAATTVN